MLQKIVELNYAIILNGKIGEGKTTTANKIIIEAKKIGFKVKGILSKRVYESNQLIGYDIIDVETGGSFIFARLKTKIFGPDWLIIEPLIYAFSKKALKKANNILKNSVKKLDNKTIIIIDEYGRLESKHLGFFNGFNSVINVESKKGVVLIICRNDKVDELTEYLMDKTNKVMVCEINEIESIIKILTNISED
ncbi:AAA family ATPase [Candidatus Bathyarchaeota archaeon]|nr:AAA family ATPase [Candidatus Bathyarchaeota archaeon]